MKSEVISNTQGMSLIILFLGGTTSLLTLGIGAEQDFWMAILLAVLIAIPIYCIFSRLHQLFPGKNLFDIIELCFDKVTAKILIILFTLFCYDEGTEVIINATQFISSTSLFDTPRIVLVTCMILACLGVAKAGLEVLGRFAAIIRIPFLAIVIVCLVILIPSMDLKNLQPVFSQDIKTILKATHTTFTFPFGEIFVFSIVFSSFRSVKAIYKTYLLALLIGALIPLLISTTSVLVLGVDEAASYFHPSYFTLRRISIGKSIDRIEILASIIYIIGTFIKVSIYLIAISKGLAKIFGYDDYRFMVVPSSLLVINLSSFYAKDMLDFWEFAEKVWIYYAIPFEVIFPVLIFIAAELKKNKISNLHKSDSS